MGKEKGAYLTVTLRDSDKEDPIKFAINKLAEIISTLETRISEIEKILLKKSGLNVDEAYNELMQDERVQDFIDGHKGEDKKILENLKISVHARYGENNTAIKVMSDDDLVEGLPQ